MDNENLKINTIAGIIKDKNHKSQIIMFVFGFLLYYLFEYIKIPLYILSLINLFIFSIVFLSLKPNKYKVLKIASTLPFVLITISLMIFNPNDVILFENWLKNIIIYLISFAIPIHIFIFIYLKVLILNHKYN